MRYLPLMAALTLSAMVSDDTALAQGIPDKLLWGDVHLHSNLSWDAYFNANETGDVDVAYRFAQGLPVIHPYHRAKVRMKQPLDFLAVTDHAEFLGLPHSLLSAKDPRLTSTRLGSYIQKVYRGEGGGVEALISMILAFQTSLLPPPGSDEENAASRFPPPPPQVDPGLIDWLLENRDMWPEFYRADVMRTNWETIVDAAGRYNRPGEFTTLIGWEYSAQANGGNLHRVVISPMDETTAKQIRPFSFLG